MPGRRQFLKLFAAAVASGIDGGSLYSPTATARVIACKNWSGTLRGLPINAISVQRFFEENYRPFFKAVEPIFHKYGGRPRWGRLNTVGGQEFANMYARWQDFVDVRRQLDPTGKFLNPYLSPLFGARS